MRSMPPKSNLNLDGKKKEAGALLDFVRALTQAYVERPTTVRSASPRALRKIVVSPGKLVPHAPGPQRSKVSVRPLLGIPFSLSAFAAA